MIKLLGERGGGEIISLDQFFMVLHHEYWL